MDQAKRTTNMKDLEDAFIKVTFEEDNVGTGPQADLNADDPFYDSWVDQGGLHTRGSSGGLYELGIILTW